MADKREERRVLIASGHDRHSNGLFVKRGRMMCGCVHIYQINFQLLDNRIGK